MMIVERGGDGVWLRHMPVWVVDTLMRMPEWLESDDDRVRGRLIPQAYEDEQEEQEWRAHVTPELEHLFASRSEVVRRDLQQLQVDVPEDEAEDEAEDVPEDEAEDDAEDEVEDEAEDEVEDEADDDGFALSLEDGMTFSLKIAGGHVSAWLTSLQAATHAVFLLEGLTEEDIGKDPRTEQDPQRQMGMMRLLILQELLVMLCEE